jgi:hypothetical protein
VDFCGLWKTSQFYALVFRGLRRTGTEVGALLFLKRSQENSPNLQLDDNREAHKKDYVEDAFPLVQN